MAAGAYSYLGATGQMLPDKAFEIVHRYADKALELDNTWLKDISQKPVPICFMNGNGKQAYEALQEAIRLNPGCY